MEVNRVIPHSQRLHELIIYDFMNRYYASKIARSKKDSVIKANEF
jgi:lantibiotic biosynthesis protein